MLYSVFAQAKNTIEHRFIQPKMNSTIANDKLLRRQKDIEEQKKKTEENSKKLKEWPNRKTKWMEKYKTLERVASTRVKHEIFIDHTIRKIKAFNWIFGEKPQISLNAIANYFLLRSNH